MTRHHVVYISDRPPVSPWPIVLTLAVLIWLWQALLVVAAVAVLLVLVWLSARWWGGQVDAQMRVNAALAQRADEQHAALHRGDPRGLYGNFPPANLS